MRIAVVGSYGNGKTTLSRELAEVLGVPRVHATPMRLRAGAVTTSLEECTDPELVQLVIRRLVERVSAESAAAAGFISDGSVLHEFVYAATRLRYGLHPERGATPRSPLPFEAEIIDRLTGEVAAHAAATYTAFVHVPDERPLADDPPPINDAFRALLDARMLDLIADLGIPVIRVSGSVRDRLDAAVRGVTGRETVAAEGVS